MEPQTDATTFPRTEAEPSSAEDADLPFSPSAQVSAALADYLAENGFTVEEYTAPTVKLKIAGRAHHFPNTRDRQWAIPLHDLHHVATGYGTDWVGEAEIGAWELRAGCRTPVVYGLNLMAVAIGLAMAPRRVLEAWRTARRARSMYRSGIGYDEALRMSVGELRDRLGIPEDGLARARRRPPRREEESSLTMAEASGG